MREPVEIPEVPPASPEILEAAAEAGLEFDPGDLDRLHGYLQALYEANAVMNLTGVRDPGEAWSRHVLDSLSLLPWISGLGTGLDEVRVLDVGSGGGCPGIPLACVLGDVKFTLLETTAKKARFLEATVKALGLGNVDVLADRAETAGRLEGQRGHYHLVMARAVGRLPVLLELTVPFAVEGGLVLAIKGEQAAAEIEESRAALHRLHARVVESVRTATGTVVVVEKTRPTPKIYPRPAGEPKRSPLRK
ncbi:MAG: 16S rRNA (guanine(527)-N(7))-methyltransferase RsmG [Phycisphaerales bacterium]|nr:16S rRNA (guanine(527)-N(7))-methyltransferase RsmG [Phycisphaerales bacterium]